MAALVDPGFLEPPADPAATDPGVPDPSDPGTPEPTGSGFEPPDPAGAGLSLPGSLGGQDTSGPYQGSTPSPYDITSQATTPTDGTGSPWDILASGINGAPATPEGQTARPLTAEERLFQNAYPGGGSFANPNAGLPGSGNGRPLTVEEQFAQSRMPNGGTISAGGDLAPHAGLPGGGAPGSAPTGAGPGGSWQDAFTKKEGYYDPRWNNADSITQELQRGGNANWKQAQDMAGLDPRIDALVNQIRAIGPDQYFASQNSNTWRADHGQQISQRVASGEYGNNQAAIGNLLSQREAPVANPIDNFHAYSTQGLRDSLATGLEALGATNIRTGVDAYGNLALTYQDRSGRPQSIAESLTNYAGALDKLKAAAAAEAAATPQATGGGGGGGYAPQRTAPRSNFAPPRSTYTPPAAAASQAPAFAGFAQNPDVSNENPIGSSAATDALAQQRAAEFAALANQNGGAGRIPKSVASAVAYSPGIYPGGYSPYDQP